MDTGAVIADFQLPIADWKVLAKTKGQRLKTKRPVLENVGNWQSAIGNNFLFITIDVQLATFKTPFVTALLQG